MEKNSGAKLWRISLRPDPANCPPCHEDLTSDAQEEVTLEAFSA